jgi:hypothetical protein
MHIPAGAEENWLSRKHQSPHIVPVSQALFLATGMLVPATDRRGLGTAKEHPSYAQ